MQLFHGKNKTNCYITDNYVRGRLSFLTAETTKKASKQNNEPIKIKSSNITKSISHKK